MIITIGPQWVGRFIGAGMLALSGAGTARVIIGLASALSGLFRQPALGCFPPPKPSSWAARPWEEFHDQAARRPPPNLAAQLAKTYWSLYR